MGIITSLLVLSFLVFFHEFGHFLMARFFGVRVEVFSIGFGKVLFSKKIGQTEYLISAIPLGGYVQMKGQNDLDPTLRNEDDDSYNTKKPWQRIFILLAGPFANIFLAFLLYIMVGVLGIEKLAPTVGQVIKDSPAFQADLQKDDKILEIDNNKIKIWKDIGTNIKNSQNSVLTVKIERDGKILIKKLTPKVSDSENIFREKIKKKMIGIAPSGETVLLQFSILGSFSYAYHETIFATTMIAQSVQKLISGAVPADQLGGVFSIVDYTSKAASMGIVPLLVFTALLSVNLGVLNLLPIPALDGGHIIFNLYEMITKKPPNEEIMYKLTIFGWILLLSLMVFGLYNDIVRFISS